MEMKIPITDLGLNWTSVIYLIANYIQEINLNIIIKMYGCSMCGNVSQAAVNTNYGERI